MTFIDGMVIGEVCWRKKRFFRGVERNMSSTCSQCGATLDRESPLSCKYCNAQQIFDPLDALGRRRVPMTDEGILSYLRETLGGLDSVSLAPAIPPKKLTSIRRVHAATLPAEENILAVYDGTLFGSATEGFFLTKKRIGVKNQMTPPHFVQWSEVDPDTVWTEDNAILVGSLRVETLYGSESNEVYTWSEVIGTLARSARPDDAPARAATESLSRPPAKGWGTGPSSWPPMPTAFHSPDHIEQLPRAPYDVAQGCGVVDVHPSGTLVLLGGGGTLELRNAGTGASVRTVQVRSTIRVARFVREGREILVGTDDRSVFRYDTASFAQLGSSPAMSDTCEAIAPLGADMFVVASQRGEVWIVQTDTMQVVCPVLSTDRDYEMLGGITSLSEQGIFFVSVGNRVGAFDRTGNVLWRVDEALTHPAELAVSSQSDLLVAASDEGVALFSARTGQPGPRFPFQSPRGVRWPEGGLLSRLRRDDTMYTTFRPRPRFSPAGDVVAMQDRVGNLLFLDVATRGTHAMPRVNGRAFIEDLAWFGDNNHVLVGMSDNTMAIWSVRPHAGVLHAKALSV